MGNRSKTNDQIHKDEKNEEYIKRGYNKGAFGKCKPGKSASKLLKGFLRR